MIAEEKTDKSLLFLQEKIKEVGTAICYNDSAALVKLPTSVVHVLDVDEEGHIWFLLPRPTQLQLRELEEQFPVQLDFHKKGVACNLQVSGTASLVLDRKTIWSLKRKAPAGSYVPNKKYVAIRVKMNVVQYIDRATNEKKSFLQLLSSFIQQIWQVEPHHRYFQLQMPNN